MSGLVIRPGDTLVVTVDADEVPNDPDSAQEYLDQVRAVVKKMLPGCEVAVLAGAHIAAVYRPDGDERT